MSDETLATMREMARLLTQDIAHDGPQFVALEDFTALLAEVKRARQEIADLHAERVTLAQAGATIAQQANEIIAARAKLATAQATIESLTADRDSWQKQAEIQSATEAKALAMVERLLPVVKAVVQIDPSECTHLDYQMALICLLDDVEPVIEQARAALEGEIK